MCAIIGWSGSVPTGLLTHLLVEAETRGCDSTGIAYRDELSNTTRVFRDAVPAHRFTRLHKSRIKEARMSRIGIMHTRRASPGMPINSENAHPFSYLRYVFAHNGAVSNWKQVRDSELEKTRDEISSASSEDPRLPSLHEKMRYLESARTDSMVIGPSIARLDLSELTGSFGLVWMKLNAVYAARADKELMACEVRWSHRPDPTKRVDLRLRSLTLVSSTQKIVTRAFSRLGHIDYSITPITLDEGKLYHLQEDGIYDEGDIPLNSKNSKDEFTSSDVADAETTAEISRIRDEVGE